MSRWLRVAAVGVALLSSRVAQAQTYTFLVDYFGGGVAQQAAGSDNILGTNILPGDSFFWRISAQNGQWFATTAADQFPFMAFGVSECGDRLGDYTLNLFNGATNVLSDVQANVPHSCVHMGTNTISLANGLTWDRMELSFTLHSAIESPQYAPDPNNLQPINSTITTLGPIFGMPENNQFYPGVAYRAQVVPEPATFALFAVGLGVVGVVARRRRA